MKQGNDVEAEQGRHWTEAEAHWRQTRFDISAFNDHVRDLVGNPKLALQHRELWHLELNEPAFPIARLTNVLSFPHSPDWGAMFLTLPARYKNELDLPWATKRRRDHEYIGEGKTVRQMMHSLLNEPIRKPVELMLVDGIGTFVHSGGNNRIGACVLTGRTTVPAHACLFLWPDGDYPGDDIVREAWRSASAAPAVAPGGV